MNGLTKKVLEKITLGMIPYGMKGESAEAVRLISMQEMLSVSKEDAIKSMETTPCGSVGGLGVGEHTIRSSTSILDQLVELDKAEENFRLSQQAAEEIAFMEGDCETAQGGHVFEDHVQDADGSWRVRKPSDQGPVFPRCICGKLLADQLKDKEAKAQKR
jgi:hypothetical protein